MIFTVTKPIEIDAKYLFVYVGGRIYPEDINFGDKEYSSWSEVMEDYPALIGNITGDLELFLKIDVETGKVLNWPANKFGDFRTIKAVDEGIYILTDKLLNEIVRYEGYVPNCLEIETEGYGDYFEFTISNGYINNWKFTEKDVNELFEIYDI